MKLGDYIPPQQQGCEAPSVCVPMHFHSETLMDVYWRFHDLKLLIHKSEC